MRRESQLAVAIAAVGFAMAGSTFTTVSFDNVKLGLLPDG